VPFFSIPFCWREIKARRLCEIILEFIGKSARNLLVICASKKPDNIKETKRSFTFGSDRFTNEKKTELAKFSRDELIKKANDEEVIEIDKKIKDLNLRKKEISGASYAQRGKSNSFEVLSDQAESDDDKEFDEELSDENLEIVFLEQNDTVKRIYKVTSRKSRLFKLFKPSEGEMTEANIEILKDVVRFNLKNSHFGPLKSRKLKDNGCTIWCRCTQQFLNKDSCDVLWTFCFDANGRGKLTKTNQILLKISNLSW